MKGNLTLCRTADGSLVAYKVLGRMGSGCGKGETAILSVGIHLSNGQNPSQDLVKKALSELTGKEFDFPEVRDAIRKLADREIFEVPINLSAITVS